MSSRLPSPSGKVLNGSVSIAERSDITVSGLTMSPVSTGFEARSEYDSGSCSGRSPSGKSLVLMRSP